MNATYPLRQQVTICAWCGKELGRRWTRHGGVSHGICPACAGEVRAEHAAMRAAEGEEG